MFQHHLHKLRYLRNILQALRKIVKAAEIRAYAHAIRPKLLDQNIYVNKYVLQISPSFWCEHFRIESYSHQPTPPDDLLRLLHINISLDIAERPYTRMG